ncbi:hypothetical protein BDD43_0997 [Mucilaginibacter gracilis]|uniref:Uncharacterized protein n=1 Tax=Mucilaginibacter gracilis TaxID=423350 RepID=A0A495IVV9_9SPHI|nr:hypothetical protein [Mucilaginibacter gracilis]RKR80860.1 hypothetical protein BDD43_0997 [Mucilaginibacter gracilis]
MRKRPILLLAFLLSLFSALGQTKTSRLRYHILTEAETKVEQYKAGCVHRNTYSAVQRLKFYPFNKATKVELVSFIGMSARNVLVYVYDVDSAEQEPLKKIKYWKYPFDDYKADTSQFIESKLLDKVQINKLTDILYNIGERKANKYPYAGYKCYEPRNAIVFINAEGKIFAYIEICFECKQIKIRPEKMKIGDFCDDKISIFKTYFASAGILYGIHDAYTRNFDIVKSR